MMRYAPFLLVLFVAGCATSRMEPRVDVPQVLIDELAGDPEYQQMKARIVEKSAGLVPSEWGENVSLVKRKMKTDEKVVALTFDACGSEGDGYDNELIEYLRKKQIPATLFVSGRWIDKNPELFMELAADPLFEIGNHGLEHKPCSVNGKSIYGIAGTESVGEVVDEVELNARKIALMTGVQPRFYRSGTAYYDDIATQVCVELEQEVVGFDIVGDAGARFPWERVKEVFLRAEPGSIIIAHMNHPARETAEGVKKAIPILKKKGFTFVKLSDYDLVEYTEATE